MSNKTPTDLLTPSAKTKAVKAIEAMHVAYYEAETGVRALYEKLERQVESTSKHIFNLAQDAFRQADGDFDAAIEIYKQMCKYAEDAYKRNHDVPNVYETLPVWRVFKSNIMRGLRNRLNPLDYNSEIAYRRATTDSLLHPAGGFSSRQVEQLQEWLNSATIPREIRPHLSHMLAVVEFLKESSVHEAEEVLAEAVERLLEYADRRKPGVRKLLKQRE